MKGKASRLSFRFEKSDNYPEIHSADNLSTIFTDAQRRFWLN
jgi:hypothetical protein